MYIYIVYIYCNILTKIFLRPNYGASALICHLVINCFIYLVRPRMQLIKHEKCAYFLFEKCISR